MFSTVCSPCCADKAANARAKPETGASITPNNLASNSSRPGIFANAWMEGKSITLPSFIPVRMTNLSLLLLQRQGLQKCYRSKGPPSALLTVQMAYSLQRGAQGYFSIPATRHVAPAPCCAVASVHPPQRHGIQPAP